MGTVLSPRPVAVAQGKGPLCWAACTTSWLTVNKERPQLNLKQLVERYGDPKQNGGITFNDKKWQELTEAMRWTNTWDVRIVNALDLNLKERQLTRQDLADTIIETLFVRGYLLLVDNHTPGNLFREGISHMYVVFGITTPTSGVDEMFVMNPTLGTFDRVSIASLVGHKVALIGTKEKLTDARKPFPTFRDPDK